MGTGTSEVFSFVSLRFKDHALGLAQENGRVSFRVFCCSCPGGKDAFKLQLLADLFRVVGRLSRLDVMCQNGPATQAIGLRLVSSFGPSLKTAGPAGPRVPRARQVGGDLLGLEGRLRAHLPLLLRLRGAQVRQRALRMPGALFFWGLHGSGCFLEAAGIFGVACVFF